MLAIKDPENLEGAKEAITRIVGFNCSQYSENFISRRIEVRLRANNICSYKGYIEILEANPQEREKLLKELTIHVTLFFRDAAVFELIKEKVIPLIISHKESERDYNIRVWSAGCSTGEEAYSIAIILKEAMKGKSASFKTIVIATDIDKKSIEIAKRGSYQLEQLKQTDTSYINRYFEKCNELYNVRDSIKEIVTFQEGDILSGIKPRNIDIILCRNTVIYFDSKTKSNLYEEMYSMLKPNGFLIMGKTETLTGPAHEMFQVFNTKERIYRKEKG